MPNRFVFTPEATLAVQRFIVERAHRWIFARRPEPWVSRMKPRVVDEAAFKAEQDAWNQWHEEQCRAETEDLV